MDKAGSILLTKSERCRLERIVADRNSAHKHVWRSRIVVLSADGVGLMAVARATGTTKHTVWEAYRLALESAVS